MHSVLLLQSLSSLFGKGSLELTPAALSLLYQGGILLVILLLLLSFLRNPKNVTSPVVGNLKDLPKEVRRKLGVTSANWSLTIWRWVFIALALMVFGFHAYWTIFADEYNE